MTRHIRTYISGIAICIFCLYLFYASRYGSAIFVVTISCGILLLMLLALCIRKRAYCFKYTDLLFVLFFAVYAVYAVVIDRTPFSSERAIGWVCAGMLYGCVRLWGRVWLTCGALFGIAVAQGVYGALQWGGVLPSRKPFFPATGSFFNPALLALCLAVGWFAGGRLLQETKRKAARGVLGGVLLAMAAGIVLLDSRAAWFGGIAGGVWLWATSSKGRKSLAHPWAWAGLPLLMAGIGVALYHLRPASAAGRLFIWETAGRAWMESPWKGGGNFAATYLYHQAERTAGMAWDDPAWLLADNNVFAFNEFLRIGYESGLPGFVPFVALAVAALWAAWRSGESGRWTGAMLCAYIGFACFGYPLSDPLCVATGVAVLAICANGKAGVLREGRFSRAGKVVAIGLLCVACCWGVREGLILRQAEREWQPIANGRGGWKELAACKHYERIRRNPDWMLRLGKGFYDREMYADALPVLQEAVRLCPTAEAVCDLGDCYQYAGHYAEAEETYRLSARMVPSRITPHSRLLELYQEIGDKDAVRQEASYILKMPVKVVNTSVIRARHKARNILAQPK